MSDTVPALACTGLRIGYGPSPVVTALGRLTGMAGFNPVDSEDGWRRMLAFFGEHV